MPHPDKSPHAAARWLAAILLLLPPVPHGWAPAMAQPANTVPAASAAACRGVSGAWDMACVRALYRAVPQRWPAPAIDAGIAWREWGAAPPADAPPLTWTAGNPGQAQLANDLGSPAILTLGAVLFADPRLSRRSTVSCSSCHRPERSFSDGRALAVGTDGLMGRRRSMPLFAAPFAPSLFWDGRAASLQEQVLAPIGDPREMDHDLASVRDRLQGLDDYPPLFQAAYGDSRVDEAGIARALAAFVATIRPPETRFDRFVAGDASVLTDQEMLGLHLFRTRARCMNCHNGPLLTDNRLHNIGLSFLGRRNQDLGRYEVTRNPADAGAFRTPSLRGVARAGPWMHNGIFPSLTVVVRMYNAGMPSPQPAPGTEPQAAQSRHIRPLQLSTQEIEALVAFLGTL